MHYHRKAQAAVAARAKRIDSIHDKPQGRVAMVTSSQSTLFASTRPKTQWVMDRIDGWSLTSSSSQAGESLNGQGETVQ